jgi:hypothetical protein
VTGTIKAESNRKFEIQINRVHGWLAEVYLALSFHVDMILTFLLCSTIRENRDLLIANVFTLG